MSCRLLFACTLFVASCAGSVSTDADASASRDGCGPSAASSDAIGDVSAPAPATATYAAVVIRDKSADPAFINGKCGASPGMDLDCVGLYRADKLIAVGKPGTGTYLPTLPTVCGNPHDVTASADGPLDGFAYADNAQDSGYISLNGGAIELQFGACQTGSNITNCDGKGDPVLIESGDQIDVWEVDRNYLTGSGTGADGHAWDSCTCYAGEYTVELRPKVGDGTGAVPLPTFCDVNSPDGKVYVGSMTVNVP